MLLDVDEDFFAAFKLIFSAPGAAGEGFFGGVAFAYKVEAVNAVGVFKFGFGFGGDGAVRGDEAVVFDVSGEDAKGMYPKNEGWTLGG